MWRHLASCRAAPGSHSLQYQLAYGWIKRWAVIVLTVCLPFTVYCSLCQPVVGVVYNFVTDELYAAQKGKGATVNGKPLRVSPCTGAVLHVVGWVGGLVHVWGMGELVHVCGGTGVCVGWCMCVGWVNWCMCVVCGCVGVASITFLAIPVGSLCFRAKQSCCYIRDGQWQIPWKPETQGRGCECSVYRIWMH